MKRYWKPILGLLVGLALLGRAWYIERDLTWVPLSVPSASLLARPLDTSIVLLRSGRIQLVHDFAIPPGEVRDPLFGAGRLIEFDGAIAGRRWSTVESGSTGTWGGGGSAGFILGSTEAARGDTLRLTIRASPALEQWVQYTPRLEVRRHYVDTMYASFRWELAELAGWIAIVVSAVVYWRARRRAATVTPVPETPMSGGTR